MIFVIVGPTGVGKSSLSIEYALKKDAVVINGDAFQCYKEMNIGTAKPSIEERNKCPHLLFDLVTCEVNYTIFDYQKALRKTLDELSNSGKDIVIVGGSGLYLKSALYDFDLNETKTKVDMSKFDNYSNIELHEYLKTIDEESSKNIHFQNRKRVLRAIEIYLESGETKSSLIAKQQHKLLYDVEFIGITKEDRSELYEIINKRVDLMIKEGLIDEVKYLLTKFSPDLRAFQAIGYKELISALNSNSSIEDAIELIKKNTRNYAKRQYTYFNNQLPVKWFNQKSDALKYMLEYKKD